MEHIVEPYRMNLLDILRKNLKAAKRVTYVHRVIYVSSHSFPNYATAYEYYQKLIEKIHKLYLDERVTGLLLFYPDYFCNVLESSEQALNQVLIESTKHPSISPYVHTRKLLAVYHNVNQRLLEDWMVYSDKPATLLEKIELDVDRQTAMRHVYNCIRKLHGLIVRLRPTADEDKALSEQHLKKSSFTSITFQNPVRVRLTDFLPEYTLLDFLLKTEHTEELNNYVLNYGHIPDSESYRSMVWPPMPSYVPFNVFEGFQDPIPDLPPRELIKLKEVEVPQAKVKETGQ